MAARTAETAHCDATARIAASAVGKPMTRHSLWAALLLVVSCATEGAPGATQGTSSPEASQSVDGVWRITIAGHGYRCVDVKDKKVVRFRVGCTPEVQSSGSLSSTVSLLGKEPVAIAGKQVLFTLIYSTKTCIGDYCWSCLYTFSFSGADAAGSYSGTASEEDAMKSTSCKSFAGATAIMAPFQE